MNDEDRKILEELEASGVISKGLSAKIATASKIADVVGLKRLRLITATLLAVLTCLLMSLGAWAPWHWLEVLAFSLMVVSAVASVLFFGYGVGW